MQWYYARNQEQVGPVDDAGIRNFVRKGTIGADDLVWNESFGDRWRKAGEVPELFPPSIATSIPPSPPPISSSHASDRAASSMGASPYTTASGPFFSRTSNRDLMASARESLRGNWGRAVLVALVYWIIGSVASVASLLISGPLALGLVKFYLPLSRGESPEVSALFSGFDQFLKAMAAYLLMALFILLWSLLLIVPGIIAACRYSQTYYLLHDNPDLGPLEAIRRSKEMMAGNKWKYFCLGWRFLGWALLCMLTCGIGFLWLMPYISVSQAKFYDDLNAEGACRA